VAKALGADLVGLATPLLRAADRGSQAVLDEIGHLMAVMRIAMFAAGAGSPAALCEPGRMRTWDDPWQEAEGED